MDTEKKIEDIPGVGVATAEKLICAGYGSIESIAVASAHKLAIIIGISEFIAQKIINAARTTSDIGGFEPNDVILTRRMVVGKISLGNKALDRIMGGGVETQAITELHGLPDTGRTQICHQMAVNVQFPQEQGGLSGSVIYLDSINTFNPERIIQMVKGVSKKYKINYDPAEFLKHIHIAKADTSNQQILLIENATKLAETLQTTDRPVRLLIVNSLTALFVIDYGGSRAQGDKQQKLNQHMHHLMQFATKFNAAILVTNNVTYKNSAFGCHYVPDGGHIVAHTTTFRLYLKRIKKTKKHEEIRIARLVESPNLPERETKFTITIDGIK